MVVGTHAAFYINLEANIHELVNQTLTLIATPIFFLVDGFIFSSKQKIALAFNYKTYLVNSTYRLLVPWFLFSCIFLVIRFMLEYFGFFTNHIVYGINIYEIPLLFYSSELSSQMYFLLSLFIIRTLTPLTIKLCSMHTFIVLIITAAYISFYNAVEIPKLFYYPLDPILHALWGIQFYFTGLLLTKLKTEKELVLLSISLLLLIIISSLVTGNISPVKQFTYLLILFHISKWALNNVSFFNTIGKQTMGIYILHVPLIVFPVALLSNQVTNNPNFQFVLVWLTTFIISFYASKILTQHKIGSIFFGNFTKAK